MTTLDFSVNPKRPRDPKAGEFYYRVELADGREVLVVAEDVVTVDGCLRFITEVYATLVLPAGSWRSVYMCEAFHAYDPWSILQLDAPSGEA